MSFKEFSMSKTADAASNDAKPKDKSQPAQQEQPGTEAEKPAVVVPPAKS